MASPYYSHCDFIYELSNKLDNFNVLSLNCQSLNAKFDKLILLIEELKQNNFQFSVICLQETWLGEEADLTLYQIPDYSCIAEGKSCSEHGGLIIYVHNNYQFDKYPGPFRSNIWEGLFIKIISHDQSKNIYIGNIYRPPRDNLTSDSVSAFTNELNTAMAEIIRCNSLFLLAGDFNLDLLKVNDKIYLKEYLDSMISLGMYPSLTLPTRLTETSATLIDNLF